MKKYFDGLQRVSKGLKKGLKNDVISMILPLEDLLKQSEANSLFSEKVRIKECLDGGCCCPEADTGGSCDCPGCCFTCPCFEF